jgi:pyruvate kinase
LSLADGVVELEVTAVRPPEVLVRVLAGGVVSTGKGVNIPGGALTVPALTEKDDADLRFGLAAGVDWVALSFVRRPEDAELPRRVMAELGKRVPLLAKIEKPQAVASAAAVIAAFDGIMVARGDLGVEVPFEDVPAIQKELVRSANVAAKPVIVATQMLLSMVQSPRPTRAEAADVANAVLDGADAVMLSEETAVGTQPAAAVTTMARIMARAEELHDWGLHPRAECCGEDVGRAIAHATWEVSRLVGAKVIVTATTSGSTARRVAATRPQAPILALSTEAATVTALMLTWGVVPGLMPPTGTTDALFDHCREQVLALALARPGDRIVVTAGLPIETPGTTNLLRVLEV